MRLCFTKNSYNKIHLASNSPKLVSWSMCISKNYSKMKMFFVRQYVCDSIPASFSSKCNPICCRNSHAHFELFKNPTVDSPYLLKRIHFIPSYKSMYQGNRNQKGLSVLPKPNETMIAYIIWIFLDFQLLMLELSNEFKLKYGFNLY